MSDLISHLRASGLPVIAIGFARELDGGGEISPVERFSFDEIVGHLREACMPAYVAQTGGGVATIYIGFELEEAEDERVEALLGPGWFEGEAPPDGCPWGAAWGGVGDSCYGPDDDGRARPTYIQTKDTAAIARDVIAFVTAERAKRG